MYTLVSLCAFVPVTVCSSSKQVSSRHLTSPITHPHTNRQQANAALAQEALALARATLPTLAEGGVTRRSGCLAQGAACLLLLASLEEGEGPARRAAPR